MTVLLAARDDSACSFGMKAGPKPMMFMHSQSRPSLQVGAWSSRMLITK